MDFQLTSKALQYSLNELARRIGLSAEADGQGQIFIAKTPVYYSPLDNNSFPARSIVIVPCAPDYFWEMITSVSKRIKWLSPDDVFPQGRKPAINEKIPVLAWGEGLEDNSRPFAEVLKNGTIVFYADILASTFFMLSRWEEAKNTSRDEHDRFPGEESFAYCQGFLERPIIDEYAIIFSEWVKILLRDWQPKKNYFSVQLSHDVDHIFTFPSSYELLKRLGGDLLHRQSIKLAFNSLLLGIKERINPYKDSREYQAVLFLAEQSKKAKIQSTFFFLATKHSHFDSGYNINSNLLRKCIDDLLINGFRVGLHPSYVSYNNIKKLTRETAEFSKNLRTIKFGCRQHYLRFNIPTTWNDLESLGITYDSSMTYAHHSGFRCGTCFPYQPFDFINDRCLSIIEEPLIVMESAILEKPDVGLDLAEEKIMLLAKRCASVGGVFTLLWHNRTIVNHPEWTNIYLRVLEKLNLLQKEKSTK